MSLLNDACAYLAAGLSVIPCDKISKAPKIKSWAEYQKQLPNTEDLPKWFANGAAIAVIAGPVSGNVEIIDFDVPEFATRWQDVLRSWGAAELLKKLLVERSPRGGYHVAYRFSGQPMGNKKLAWSENAAKTAIETRGDGGYALVAPSEGYRLLRGSWTALQAISVDERDTILSAARSLDEKPRFDPSPQGRVGDDYNARAHIAEILEPLGWRRFKSNRYWTRPGKPLGVSLEWFPDRRVQVYTTSVLELAPQQYDLFGLFARLRHNGDFTQATRAAAESGYGDQSNTYRPKLSQLVAAERAAAKWVFANEVTCSEVDWLFKPYIPRGELSLISGDPGVGKSTVAQAIATAVTLGASIGGTPCSEGPVIFLSAEQSKEQVTVPRFRELEADLSKIVLPDEDEDGLCKPFVLDSVGMAELEMEAQKIKPALIVVDTITAYIEARRDMNAANSVREWMRQLTGIARTTHCAVLLITHQNKNTQDKALFRVMGSMDFIGASRSVMTCGHDPDNPRHCAIAHIKSNVGVLGPSLGFSIIEGRFGWTGVSNLTSVRMGSEPVSEADIERLAACKEWLLDRLGSGAVSARDIEAEARSFGFQKACLDKARISLGVRLTKDKFADNALWEYRLPSVGQAPAWWAE